MGQWQGNGMNARHFSDGCLQDDRSPRVLTNRLDRLVLRYRFSNGIRDADMAYCRRATEQMRRSLDGSLDAVDLQDVEFLFERPRKIVNNIGSLFWVSGRRELVCSFNAFVLAKYGHALCLEMAEFFVSILNRGRDSSVTGCVSQAHLCCDIQPMPDISLELLDAVVGTRLRHDASFRTNRRTTGIAYGNSGRLQAVIYDKKLASKRPKYNWCVEEWGRSKGFNRDEGVWRVEFRLASAEAIRRKGFPVDPVLFLNSLPEIWRELCTNTLWLRRPTRTRSKDCPRFRWWNERILALDWEGAGCCFSGGERPRDSGALIAQIRGLVASVVSAHSGEGREDVKAQVEQPLEDFLGELMEESLNRMTKGRGCSQAKVFENITEGCSDAIIFTPRGKSFSDGPLAAESSRGRALVQQAGLRQEGETAGGRQEGKGGAGATRTLGAGAQAEGRGAPSAAG